LDTGGETTVGTQDLFLISDYGHSNSEDFEVGDPTPSGITVTSPWVAGATTPVTITGTGFGTNPTVTFSDGTIVWALGTATDTGQPGGAKITGTVTLLPCTSAEGVTVTVKSNGYNGTGFVASTSGESPDGTGDASVTPQPTITGGKTVWYFKGQNPAASAYPISVALSSSGGSSTTWSVSQADAKVNLSTTSGATTTVTPTGSHFSASVGDIKVSASIGGGSPCGSFAMSAKMPWKLSLVSRVTSAYGTVYLTTITYNLLDNLSSVMSSSMADNEVVGTFVSLNGSNWASFPMSTGSGVTPVTDKLSPNGSSSLTPKPKYDGNPGTGTTPYMSAPQKLYVGSSTSGSGVLVQTDTLTYYIDNGNHTGKSSPAQPPQ